MPKCYVVVDVEVQDAAAYQEYREQAGPNVVVNGGRYLVRGGAVEVLEGDWTPHRFVVLEFPTAAAARRWYSSPAYQGLMRIRQRTTRSSLVLVEGARGPGPFDALPAPLRLATDEEAPQVGRLLQQLGCLRWDGDEAKLAEAVRHFQDAGTSGIVVVGAQGKPEAAAVVHFLPLIGSTATQLFVEDIVVDAAARGRGHGKTLLGGLVAWGKAQGAQMVRARSDEEGGAADALFRAFGMQSADLLYETPPQP